MSDRIKMWGKIKRYSIIIRSHILVNQSMIDVTKNVLMRFGFLCPRGHRYPNTSRFAPTVDSPKSFRPKPIRPKSFRPWTDSPQIVSPIRPNSRSIIFDIEALKYENTSIKQLFLQYCRHCTQCIFLNFEMSAMPELPRSRRSSCFFL